MSFKAAAIWCAALIVGMLVILPLLAQTVVLPSLRQHMTDPVPGYEQIFLAVAMFCLGWRWLLAPLTVMVFFLIAAVTSESVARRKRGARPAKERQYS